jgi:hypothetical protein
MNPTERWSELWLLIDRHFPGERSEARSLKIDDLYDELYAVHIEPLEQQLESMNY